MTSDHHASYAKIGFTVSLGLVAIVATLIYLGGLRGRSDIIMVETYYDNPVTGLSVGSVVNFRGVKIGEVSEIALLGNKYAVDEKSMTRIYILMAINCEMISPRASISVIENRFRSLIIERGMRATVKVNALTGMARMEIDFNEGEEINNVPAVAWRPKHIYIPSIGSLMDSFAVAATKVMNQVNKMDLNTFWSNLNASVENVSHCAESVNVTVQSRQADVAHILDDLTATSQSLRELSAELRQNPSVIVRGVDRPPLEETAR